MWSVPSNYPLTLLRSQWEKVGASSKAVLNQTCSREFRIHNEGALLGKTKGRSITIKTGTQKCHWHQQPRGQAVRADHQEKTTRVPDTKRTLQYSHLFSPHEYQTLKEPSISPTCSHTQFHPVLIHSKPEKTGMKFTFSSQSRPSSPTATWNLKERGKKKNYISSQGYF